MSVSRSQTLQWNARWNQKITVELAGNDKHCVTVHNVKMTDVKRAYTCVEPLYIEQEDEHCGYCCMLLAVRPAASHVTGHRWLMTDRWYRTQQIVAGHCVKSLVQLTCQRSVYWRARCVAVCKTDERRDKADAELTTTASTDNDRHSSRQKHQHQQLWCWERYRLGLDDCSRYVARQSSCL